MQRRRDAAISGLLRRILVEPGVEIGYSVRSGW
jgi:hypothetical protein